MLPSMFIYDKRNGGVTVRHIEHKLGIHGSPTCELVFKNAKAELCGETRMGLIKYVMALMNSARLGIAAQSVGLGQEAYNEALKYAGERQQFHKRIIEFPAVYDMLSRMKAKIDAGRSLLYMTARYVDIYKCLEDIQRLVDGRVFAKTFAVVDEMVVIHRLNFGVQSYLIRAAVEGVFALLTIGVHFDSHVVIHTQCVRYGVIGEGIHDHVLATKITEDVRLIKPHVLGREEGVMVIGLAVGVRHGGGGESS